MHPVYRFSFTLLTLFAGAIDCAQAGPQYVMSLLGADDFVIPMAINNRGQVVGTMGPLLGQRQFFLSDGGVASTLDDVRAGTNRIDINDAGVMLYNHALHYTNGSTAGLPMTGFALNNHADVAGEIHRLGQLSLAAVYRPNGTLSVAGIAGRWNSGYDINDDGVVVGAAHGINLKTDPPGFPAFRAARYANGQAQILEPYGHGYGFANAVNKAGYAVGVTGGHAALWRPDGTLIDLGAILEQRYGPEQYSIAYGINSFGEVVGSFGDAQGFLYSNGVMYDLEPLVLNDDGLDYMAYGINDRHQIIAASAVGDGVILNLAGPAVAQPVPEPASHLVFPTCLAALCFLRRRKTRCAPTGRLAPVAPG
ncbi:hypothetical protein [Massilia sp. MS-15]|uniref:hypothetical protein n=1 Tax=Massilia sp. MS-15 TaxID=2878200 RepID=UPI001CD6B610|nr:hypothetical protein [Massilia sp. MS-15]MCA1244992.1 hypothetical protein [Massilia sp. MS-15]